MIEAQPATSSRSGSIASEACNDKTPQLEENVNHLDSAVEENAVLKPRPTATLTRLQWILDQQVLFLRASKPF